MGKSTWVESVGALLYGIITVLCIPIFLLSVIVTAWMNRLSASNRYAIEIALESRNLIVAGACGIGGSITWIIGTPIIIRHNVPGFLILLISIALWITVMVKSPWNADSTLSQFFESIPGSKGASRSITTLLALVCLSVVSFVCVLASAFAPDFYKPNKAATDVTTVSEGVAAASSIPKPAPSSHPIDLEKNSNDTSAVPAQPSSTSAENNDKPEIQDGAG